MGSHFCDSTLGKMSCRMGWHVQKPLSTRSNTPETNPETQTSFEDTIIKKKTTFQKKEDDGQATNRHFSILA